MIVMRPRALGVVFGGIAGLLRGRRATTHWGFVDQLAGLGAEPVNGRVVADGKFVTAAGVSAGIDMALSLLAEMSDEETAKTAQLTIEYDPAPPFDAGDARTATPERKERALNLIFQASQGGPA